jgi:DNA (cytosine-5)-methyltransferase 1
MSSPPTVFDCFCGLGGLSLGAELAGFEVVGGVDADEIAVQSYARNFPGRHALHHDLLKDAPRVVLQQAFVKRGDVEILVGGPPCQPYSVNNHNRGTNDVRCGLVESYLEFVSTLQPKWLVMENVPGFVFIQEGEFLKTLLRSLRGRGYSAEYCLVDASRFGVPQKRRRLVIVATKERAKLTEAMKKLTLFNSETITVGQAIGDLPEEPAPTGRYSAPARDQFQKTMRERAPEFINGHLNTKLGEKNLKRMRHVPPGGNWRDIPRRLLPAGMKRARLSDHTTRYGRLHSAFPSFTLLTKCDPHWGCFVHPTMDRVITVREAARLQSIPDRVEFAGKLASSYRLIGNSVPPLLAKGILQIIR